MSAATPPNVSLRKFAYLHDDLPAFHAAYLIITVLSAALFTMGLFAALIIAHMALDFVKYREVHHLSLRETAEGMLRESLLDVALLIVGLNFAVYLHHTMLIAGLSGLLRSEMTVLRALGTLLPKIAIVHDVTKVMVHVRHYLHHPHPRIGKGWAGIERLQIGVVLVGCALLVLAAPLSGASFTHVGTILLEELTPWTI